MTPSEMEVLAKHQKNYVFFGFVHQWQNGSCVDCWFHYNKKQKLALQKKKTKKTKTKKQKKNKQTKKQTKKTINYWLIEVKIKKTIRSSSLFSCVLPPTTFHSVSKALPVEQEHRYVKSTQDQTKNK